MAADEALDQASVVISVTPSAESEAMDREGIETLGATAIVTDAPALETLTDDKGWLASVLDARLHDEVASPALHGYRDAAFALAETAEIPSRKMELWRFTDLRKLFATRFVKTPPVVVLTDTAQLAPSEAGSVLVFVDGMYRSNLSKLDDDAAALVEAGGYMGSIAGYQGDVGAALAVFNQKEVSAESGLFAALSAALACDMCVLDIPPSFSFSKPLAFVFISSGGASGTTATVSAPKLAVLAGQGSNVTFLESHVCGDPELRPWFSSLTSTGVSVGTDAKVDHYYLNDCSQASHQLNHIHADISGNASYRLCSVSVGGQVGRLDVGIDLNGAGGHAESLGVMIADDYRIADLHSRISHNAPGCTSKQYQKNIACGHARVIFSGRIIVKQIAQQTDSQQLCRSMLLTTKAQIDAMPVLEIAADDVKCTHGATVSDLSSDELFYCQSRGLTERLAQEMLVASFAVDVLIDCPFDLLRKVAISSSRKVVPGIQKMPPRSVPDMQSI
jgi:Fe-S cluster assembly protein SufD